jgi:putative flippase GtrA
MSDRVRALSRHAGIRYVFAGGTALTVELVTLWLCHGVFGLPVWLGTTLAYAAAFGVNFSLNRLLTFADHGARDGAVHVQTVKFSILVAINYFVTLAVMNGLTSNSVNVNYLVAKVLSTGVITIYNFYVYRHWVFGSDSLRPGKRDAASAVEPETARVP